MKTVQLVSKPVAPPFNDATKAIVHALLAHRRTCDYRFFGTPGSHVLEGPHARCDVVSRTTRFQPGLAEHGRTMFRLLRPAPYVSLYHCLFTPNPRSSGLLKLILGAKRKPIVHTVCSSPEDSRRAARLLFADCVVTVSAWAKHRLEEHGTRNVVHIPPGIEVPTIDPAAARRMAAAHDLSSGRPCVLFSGDYEFSGAHGVILEALPGLIARCPDILLVFACRPKTSRAHGIESQVRQQLSSAGLLPHVRFAGEVDDFLSLLSLATIVIFPVQSLRLKMDLPVTLLQAMALGIPIVTSTYGPLPELLAEPVGIGVRPGNAEDLVAAVVALLDDPSRRIQMGQAARNLVRSRYSSSWMAQAYEDLYSSL